MRPGQMDRNRGSAEIVDGLSVVDLDSLIFSHESAGPGFDPERQVGAAGTGSIAEPGEGFGGETILTGTRGGLHQLAQGPPGKSEVVALNRPAGGGSCFLIPAQSIADRGFCICVSRDRPTVARNHYPEVCISRRCVAGGSSGCLAAGRSARRYVLPAPVVPKVHSDRIH